MHSIRDTAQRAAERLQEIAESAPGDRGLRAGAVVFRAAAAAGGEAGPFLARRAALELDALPQGPERSGLRRILELAAGPAGEGPAGEGGADLLAGALICYAGEVEKRGQLAEADAALAVARAAAPRDPEAALHAGRVARKLGEADRARALYREVAGLDAPCGRFGRLASIGMALLSETPERELGRVVRLAVRARDMEAAAIGLEERAQLRRSAGDRTGAMRDLCAAAVRFTDPVDRARVAHELADLAIAAGDALAAREALLVALELGDAAQRLHARSRLYTLARATGDQLGAHRWRLAKRSALVSLAMYRLARDASTAAPALARWRQRLERAIERATV